MASFRALVLVFVQEYIGKWHVSPSYGEIAAHFETSRTRVKNAVRSLIHDELLYRVEGPRGLRLPSRHEEALRIVRERGTNPTLLPPAELDYPARSTGIEEDDCDDAPPD